MISRRSFVETAATGASAFMVVKPELVRGAGKEKLKVGIVGCGGRGAVDLQSLLVGSPNVELTAMGDLFEDHLETFYRMIQSDAKFAAARDRIKVAPDRRFTGFDAYKKVLATDVDIVILTTPPGYRPEHFEACVKAKKHIICEKPVGTDAMGVRRFMAAAKKSEELKLSVGSGAWRRLSDPHVQTREKFRAGAIGDPVAAFAYWLGTPVLHVPSRDPKWGDMEWQQRNWYSFLWLCGDQLVEQAFHNVDCINWFLGAHPVKVVASGGLSWRPHTELYGNIYDHMSCDYTYANGIHLTVHCRQYPAECYQQSTKGIQELIYCTKGKTNCSDLATNAKRSQFAITTALVDSILGTGPYHNIAMDLAESTMTCIMGRESAYSGLEITWDMIMNSKQDLQPKAFDLKLKMDMPPVPIPGQYKFI
jgi:predicted dehydrogenase